MEKQYNDDIAFTIHLEHSPPPTKSGYSIVWAVLCSVAIRVMWFSGDNYFPTKSCVAVGLKVNTYIII